MIAPGSSVFLTRQFDRSPPVFQTRVQGCEWAPSKTRVASTFILLSPHLQERERLQFQGPSQHSLYIPSSRYLDPYIPDTSLYSIPVNQVNLDPVGAEDDPFAFFESDPSFVSQIDSTFSSRHPIQHGIQCHSDPERDLSLVCAEGSKAVGNIIQASDDAPLYSTLSTVVPPPTMLSTNLDPNVSSSRQGMEASFQTTDPYVSPSVDTSHSDWGPGWPATPFLAGNPSTSILADSAAGIYRSSYLAKGSQKVDYEAVQSASYTVKPSKRQSILFERVADLCEWKNADGMVCLEVITIASLPEHLSTHGIKKMSRNCATKCGWVGCKRKKSMNRESIVRHIREVHLGLKRSLKVARDPCISSAGLPPG